MHYCLNREQLQQLLDLKMAGTPVEDAALRCMIDGAENWQDEVGVHNYLVCLILCSRLRAGRECQRLVERLYELPDEMYLYIQELESGFVEYVLKNLRSTSRCSIEDDLVELQLAWRDYRYDATIRY